METITVRDFVGQTYTDKMAQFFQESEYYKLTLKQIYTSDAEAGKICGNGRTAVAGANDSNFFFHFVFASENVSLGRVLHSRSTRQFLLCQRDDYLCCILKSFFQKNRRSTTRIAREMPQAMKPNFIAPMLVIRKGHMEVTRPPPMKGLIRGPSSA